MPPMSAEDLTDLDFTRVMKARPVVPPPAPEPAPAPQPAPRPEVPPRAEAEIGKLGAGHAGNLIRYARAGVTGRPDAEAPVMIVEDDETTRRLMEKALTSHGYIVRGAADGPQFLQLIRRPPLPRLILLDVELPQVSGFKILTVLRQHPQTSAIPLVMLTARSENKDLLHALSLGADAYLSKPITVAALRSMVDRLLRRTS